MSDDEIGQVYPLFPDADPEAPVTVTKQKWCSHRTATVVESSRRVYCRECGVELDAFERLYKIAREHERRKQALEADQREIRKVRGELAELKREERNAKARKRRRTGLNATQERRVAAGLPKDPPKGLRDVSA